MPKDKFKFGSGNQNCTPSWAESKVRKDGKTNILYGKKGVSDPHGHTVVDKNGSTVYERTISGHVKRDVK